MPGPLKYWLDLNDSGTWGEDPTGGQDVPVVRSTDINLDGSWDLEDVALRSVPAAEVASKRLKVGDLVVVKSSGSAEHLGKTAIVGPEVEALRACFANFVQRLRPSGQADARFVWYVLNSRRAAAEMAVLGNTTTGLRNLNGSIIGSVTFPGAPFHQQRAVADFLDTETTRIDDLITKKRRMIELLRTKLAAERSQCLWGDHPAVVPLMYLTPPNRRIMYGIVLPGPDVDDGVPIVKGGDVAAGLTRKLCRTTREIESGYRRSRLRQGDLVFAIRGGIGDVAMVPTEVAGANITQDVARVTPAADVEPRWLLHVLKSPEVQRQAQMRTTGATIHGLNIWELKRLHVPDRDVEQQRSEAARLDRIERRIEAVASRLRHQAGILQERRQALISVAVTGDLEVPEVAA